MHRSHFLSVFLFLFLVYRSGAFGWIDAAQVSKKKNLSHIHPASSQAVLSCAVDTVVIVFCHFVPLRIAVYSYIYCSFGRLSIELYSPYMIMGPSRLGEMAAGWLDYHPLISQAHGAEIVVSVNHMDDEWLNDILLNVGLPTAATIHLITVMEETTESDSQRTAFPTDL